MAGRKVLDLRSKLHHIVVKGGQLGVVRALMSQFWLGSSWDSSHIVSITAYKVRFGIYSAGHNDSRSRKMGSSVSTLNIVSCLLLRLWHTSNE